MLNMIKKTGVRDFPDAGLRKKMKLARSLRETRR